MLHKLRRAMVRPGRDRLPWCRTSICATISDHVTARSCAPTEREVHPMPKPFLNKLVTFLVIAALTLVPPASKAADFKSDIIYQIVTDRFFDGDPRTTTHPKAAACLTPRRPT